MVALSFLGQKQKYKDVPFLLLYAGFALIFFVVNLIVLFKSSQSSFMKYASGSVFRAIQESLLAVTITILVSVCVGLAWLASICSVTKPLLWFTFLSIPAASFLIFVLMLTRGFVGFGYQSEDSDPSKQSKLLSLIPLSVAIIHSFIIHRYHTSIRQAIEIIRMSGIILKSNIDLVGASLCCLASHILFSALWLISFDRLFLLGHEDTISGKKTWLSDDSLYLLVPFYIVFFWWTSSIINNIERCTIAGAVSQWYFHKESNSVSGYNSTKVALRRSLTTSFGSLSLAGLIMTAVRILKFARSTYEKTSLGTGLASIGVRLALSPVMFAARAVEGISFFTVSYVGISGKPFLKSAKVASTILNRNFFHCLLANYVIRATIYSSIATVSTLTGFAFFSFSADSLRTSHTFVVGSLGVSISFFVLKFMMNILLYTTDAVYLCYGIDVDQKTNHYALAHRALSKYN
ncbi:hypothetical protein DSO57_1007645 [Entomophthora muscae]|uniref:Uncharacterized protein n=1 Tax=Entomophthora muscae TaxID=34485 RepID=A0ACC2SK11_9FUNG|nr:hypothetical protein DSO57_1007645 [Entomophthora muscae]